MNKPISVSVRDYLIKRTSEKLLVPERIISKVIQHNYKKIAEMASDNNEIELTGLGRISFSPWKARKGIDRCHKMIETIGKRESNKRRENLIEFLEKEIEWINQKLDKYEHLKDSRGMEKHPYTSKEDEGVNSPGVQGENGNMQGV